MSLYIKEKAEYFKLCMESVLGQTALPDEIVIVKDGPVSEEVDVALEDYVSKNRNLFKIVALTENKGLGLALSEGIQHCSNELVARMDTDDIAVPERFEQQLKMFESNPELDICGGQILEFEENEDNIVAERKVPLSHGEIIEYQKKRSAFNHMTVMFKKSKVLEAGNYKHCPLMEDDMLWVDMINAGAKCANLSENLCKVRTNRDMIARRGGLKYYKKYKNARKQILNTGFITKKEYRKTNRIQFLVCIMPAWLRKFVFFNLIHKKAKN
ncbi:MAG: glycosyltransferase [Clostridia bacterium]|nr:glycosyltransferase [Clostridia bacterium]